MEIALLRRAKVHLSKGYGTTEYAAIQQAELGKFLDEVRYLIRGSGQEVLRIAEQVYHDTYQRIRTRQTVGADLTEPGLQDQTRTAIEQYVLGLLAAAVLSAQSDYNTAVNRVTHGIDLDATLQALADERLASVGQYGFPEAMQYYTDQVSVETQVQANKDAIRFNQFLIVSIVFGSCPLCTPWEGRLLSRTTDNSGNPTLDDALAQGLWHRHCRHEVYPADEGIPEEVKRYIGFTPEQQAQYRAASEERRAYEAEVNRIKAEIRKFERQAAVITNPARAQVRQGWWERQLAFTERHRDDQLWRIGRIRDGDYTEVERQLRALSVTDPAAASFDPSNWQTELRQMSVRDWNQVLRSTQEVYDRLPEGTPHLAYISVVGGRGPETLNATTMTVRGHHGAEVSITYGSHVREVLSPRQLQRGPEWIASNVGMQVSPQQVRDTLRSHASGLYNVHSIHTVTTRPMTNSVEMVANHELGHYVHSNFRDEIDFPLLHGKSAREVMQAHNVSLRSQQGWEECVAENFALYIDGKGNEVAPDLRAIFERLVHLR